MDSKAIKKWIEKNAVTIGGIILIILIIIIIVTLIMIYRATLKKKVCSVLIFTNVTLIIFL